MKATNLLILIFSLMILMNSCRKMKYNEGTLSVKVINGCIGEPMEGEVVAFVEKVSSVGWNAQSNKDVIQTLVTDANGVADFGAIKMRKRDGYAYSFDYVDTHDMPYWAYAPGYDVTVSPGSNEDLIYVFPYASYNLTIIQDTILPESIDSLYYGVRHTFVDSLANANISLTTNQVTYGLNQNPPGWMGTYNVNWTVFVEGLAYSDSGSFYLDWDETKTFEIHL